MTNLLQNKTAVVTGANRGIGKAIAHIFASNGANVFACARTRSSAFDEECIEISQKYGVSITPVFFDLTDKEAVKSAVKAIKSVKTGVDILVNNAGMLPDNRSFLMADSEEIESVFATNLFGALNLTRLIAKIMLRQKKGSIVNIASIAGIDAEPGQMEYVSSKAALIGATRKLARELGAYNIRVNAIAPGIVDTDMISNMETSLKERMTEKIILKRIAKPEEIANTALYLASDLSSYVTGQTIRVDGGM